MLYHAKVCFASLYPLKDTTIKELWTYFSAPITKQIIRVNCEITRAEIYISYEIRKKMGRIPLFCYFELMATSHFVRELVCFLSIRSFNTQMMKQATHCRGLLKVTSKDYYTDLPLFFLAIWSSLAASLYLTIEYAESPTARRLQTIAIATIIYKVLW